MNLALTGYRRLAVLSLAPTDWRVSSVHMAQFATLPATVTAEKIPRMIRTPKALKPLQNLFERNRGRTHLTHLFALSGHLAPRVRARACGPDGDPRMPAENLFSRWTAPWVAATDEEQVVFWHR